MNGKLTVNLGCGGGICGFAALAFVILKLTGVISWSWWWVLAPVWIPVVIVILAILFLLWVDS